jgi:VWFA-related protein
MRYRSILVHSVLIAAMGITTSCAMAQTRAGHGNRDIPYTLKLAVNEVDVAFHVTDRRGQPVVNLSRADFSLYDNGKLQRIADFQSYHDLPIRAGFLVDASVSMDKDMAADEEIAELYADHLLRKGFDQAFVMGFGTQAVVTQDWTDNPGAIKAGLEKIPTEYYGTSGTALFDNLYRACRTRWTSDRTNITGNFILLFTDGIDNFSHAQLGDVINECQKSRTAIYIFSNQWNARGTSNGSVTLKKLTAQTGGRLFLDPKGVEVEKDVAMIDSDRRNQYLIDFSPSDLKINGSFHHLTLHCKIRGTSVLVRSGYYAVR